MLIEKFLCIWQGKKILKNLSSFFSRKYFVPYVKKGRLLECIFMAQFRTD